jgi:hypothetical protein
MGSYTMTLDDGTFIRAMRSSSVQDGVPNYWALVFSSTTGPGAGRIFLNFLPCFATLRRCQSRS